MKTSSGGLHNVEPPMVMADPAFFFGGKRSMTR